MALPDVFGQVNHSLPEGCFFQVIHPGVIVNQELLLAESWELLAQARTGTVNTEYLISIIFILKLKPIQSLFHKC